MYRSPLEDASLANVLYAIGKMRIQAVPFILDEPIMLVRFSDELP